MSKEEWYLENDVGRAFLPHEKGLILQDKAEAFGDQNRDCTCGRTSFGPRQDEPLQRESIFIQTSKSNSLLHKWVL